MQLQVNLAEMDATLSLPRIVSPSLRMHPTLDTSSALSLSSIVGSVQSSSSGEATEDVQAGSCCLTLHLLIMLVESSLLVYRSDLCVLCTSAGRLPELLVLPSVITNTFLQCPAVSVRQAQIFVPVFHQILPVSGAFYAVNLMLSCFPLFPVPFLIVLQLFMSFLEAHSTPSLTLFHGMCLLARKLRSDVSPIALMYVWKQHRSSLSLPSGLGMNVSTTSAIDCEYTFSVWSGGSVAANAGLTPVLEAPPEPENPALQSVHYDALLHNCCATPDWSRSQVMLCTLSYPSCCIQGCTALTAPSMACVICGGDGWCWS